MESPARSPGAGYRGPSRTHGGLIVPFVLAALLLACGGSDEASPVTSAGSVEASEQPRSGGTLHYGLFSETNTWDPSLGQWSHNSHAVASALFDRLAGYDEAMNVQPVLAESITPDATLTQWAIRVRPDVTFHDGDVLDADAVKANLDAFRASPLTRPVLASVAAVEVVDDRTVVVWLDGPWAEFPHVLTTQVGIMMAPAMLDAPDGGANPIGTGPFVFEEWVVDDRVVVARNDDYWNGPVHLDGIEFTVMVGDQALSAAFETGQLDVMLAPTPKIIADAREAEASGEAQMFVPERGENSEMAYLLNRNRAPLDDEGVRRALIMATDRELITDTLTNGLWEPASGMYPPSSPWHVDTGYPEYDPGAARELIAEYEAETGTDLAIEIQIPALTEATVPTQLLAEQWEAVGADVEVLTLDLTQHAAGIVTGQFEVAHFNWYWAHHPDGEFVFLHSEGSPEEGSFGLNFARNRNPDLDASLEAARATADRDEQVRIYGLVQEELNDDYVHVFIWHYEWAVVAGSHVRQLDEWELPGGTSGPGLLQLLHQMGQIWLQL